MDEETRRVIAEMRSAIENLDGIVADDRLRWQQEQMRGLALRHAVVWLLADIMRRSIDPDAEAARLKAAAERAGSGLTVPDKSAVMSDALSQEFQEGLEQLVEAARRLVGPARPGPAAPP